MRTQQRVQTACNEASNLIQVRLFTLSHISVLKFTIHLSLQRLMNNCYSMLPLVFNNWQTACNNSFSTLVLYTPEERMVSNIQENGLPDFCTQVSNLSKAAPNYFSHMGYCFTTNIWSEATHSSWHNEYLWHLYSSIYQKPWEECSPDSLER
jgi:hypothetical protein